MKDVPVSYKKGLLAGLRQDSKMGRGTENLLTCVGVYPKAGSLSDLEDETFIDVSSLGCTFPYPQYFELSGCTLVCTPTAIYSYSAGVLTEEISGLTADNLWSVADFNSYIFLTNGTETVIRNPETSEFIAIFNQETPAAECVCGTPSQLIWGGPDMSMLDMGIVPYNDARPPSVDSFTVNYDGTNVVLTWTMKEVVSDLKGFRIRYAKGLASLYEQMTDLQTALYEATATSTSKALTLTGAYAFAIVAVDQADQESIPVYRELVYGLIDFKALGWPGVWGDCQAIDDDGYLIELSESFSTWATTGAWETGSWDASYAYISDIYYFSDIIDLGSVFIGTYSLNFSAESGVAGWTITSGTFIRMSLWYSSNGINYYKVNLFDSATPYTHTVAARYIRLQADIAQPDTDHHEAYLKFTGAVLKITRA